MILRNLYHRRSKVRGFGLSYILAILGIASAILMAWARVGNQNNDGKKMASLRDEVVGQAGLIRSKLLACTILYPGGNNGLGFRLAFPVTPASGLVSDLLCPGNPNTNKSLWTSSDGVFSPRQLNGFSVWSYTHDVTSVRISITATGSGNVPTAALNNSLLRLGSQASITGSTFTVVVAN